MTFLSKALKWKCMHVAVLLFGAHMDIENECVDLIWLTSVIMWDLTIHIQRVIMSFELIYMRCFMCDIHRCVDRLCTLPHYGMEGEIKCDYGHVNLN